MKRIKKLIFHSILIIFLLFIFYYFGGYYFSKEQCIKEILRGHYATENDTIMDFENKPYSMTLVADMKNKTASLIGTRKIGFLYHAASSSLSHRISEDTQMSISGTYNSDIGLVVFIYRNDKSIEKVEVSLNDGTTLILDDWIRDFTGFILDIPRPTQGTYKAYDASHRLIFKGTY